MIRRLSPDEASWEDERHRSPDPERGSPPRAQTGLGSLLERWDPGITGGRALAVVALIAALASGVLLWASRPEPQPVPLASTPSEPVSATTLQAHPVAAPTTAAPPATPPADPLVVHVTGDVRKPGVATLPPGSRVTDALEAAGGLRRNGKVGAVNLARRLTDGEQVIIGSDAPGPLALPAAPPPPGAAGAPAVPADAPIDLNTATLDQLQQLPGVGPVLAQRILDHRTEHGSFRSVDQLQDVTGIGERRFADLKDRVHVTTP